jgi:hypothetical protein
MTITVKTRGLGVGGIKGISSLDSLVYSGQ